MNNIFKAKTDNSPFELVYMQSKSTVIKINRSANLVFDTLKSYRGFHKQAELNIEYPKKFYFLTYIVDFDETQTQSLFTSKFPYE